MVDIVERLRNYEGENFQTTACYNGLRDEAANEIDRLRAQVAAAYARGFHWQAGHSDPKVYRWPDGVCSIRIGKSRAGRLLDGREHNDFPQPVIPAQDQTSPGIQEIQL